MFDAQRFIKDHFQGHAGIIPFVSAYGMPAPSPSAVEKWFYRSAIPADWLAVLLALLELEKGGPVSVARYLRG